MTRAWEIAKKGQKRFGGKVKEYFAQALVMAWKEAKLAAMKQEKGLKIYSDYINNVIGKGGKIVSQEGTSYTIENMGKKHVVTFEMSDLTVFVKVALGKKVKYFNVGRVS